MIPFASNIIRATSESPLLDVYAITVDDDKLSYLPYLYNLPKNRITLMPAPHNGFEKYFNKIYAYRILREAKRICHNTKIDIIHLLTGDYTCNGIISRLKNLGEVYYTVHDLRAHEKAFKNIKERIFLSYMQWGVKRNMKQVKNLVTNSKNQYHAINKMYPGKNTYFHTFPSLIVDSILNGNNVCPEIRNMDKYILFFGNIEKYKGIEYLYNAFKNNNNLSGYRLIIAGNGNLYFPHADDARIIFINRYIKDDEIKSLFERAICVVYPYISATQSGVFTLAYKFRTPILASNIPFFKESSNENCCLFFKYADENDLSKKLETMLFDTDLEKIKIAQKEYYEKHYSQNAIRSSIEAIY
jgi:glycosyltransferase involved in cell wall biosynthesis